MGSAASTAALSDDVILSASDVKNIVGVENFNQYELDKIVNYNSINPNEFHITGLQLKEYIAEKASLPPIRLIDFDAFRDHGQFPRYPNDRDICTSLSEIDRAISLVVFISHCWLRGWSGAEGWDAATCPHPDNASHDKYKLCVDGMSKLIKTLAPGMTKCYVWLDFGCMDQDGNPAGELKQLDEIVRCSDCIFTPIHGMAEFPDIISDLYRDYKVAAWNGHVYGYTDRGWCRVEMFYGANIPLAVFANSDRFDKFGAGLKKLAMQGVRPHLIYGTREVSENTPPKMLPPLQNSYFSQLNPAHAM
jgi:hypothetical protein